MTFFVTALILELLLSTYFCISHGGLYLRRRNENILDNGQRCPNDCVCFEEAKLQRCKRFNTSRFTTMTLNRTEVLVMTESDFSFLPKDLFVDATSLRILKITK